MILNSSNPCNLATLPIHFLFAVFTKSTRKQMCHQTVEGKHSSESQSRLLLHGLITQYNNTSSSTSYDIQFIISTTPELVMLTFSCARHTTPWWRGNPCNSGVLRVDVPLQALRLFTPCSFSRQLAADNIFRRGRTKIEILLVLTFTGNDTLHGVPQSWTCWLKSSYYLWVYFCIDLFVKKIKYRLE